MKEKSRVDVLRESVLRGTQGVLTITGHAAGEPVREEDQRGRNSMVLWKPW